MPVVTLANGRSFDAESGVTLLDAALAKGIALEYSCRTGRCGTCKARVIRGVSIATRDEVSLDAAEIAGGFILTCLREARTDLSLDVEDLAALAGLTPRTLPCRIDKLERVASDVMQVELRLSPSSTFGFLAGQYVDVIGPNGLKRSYSIASAMNDGARIRLHIRFVVDGVMSRYWFGSAMPNDLLRLRGPLGTFFLRETAGMDLVFLATGTGYAPVRSMLAQLDTMKGEERPRSVRVYWGGRLPADIYERPFSSHARFEFTPVLSRADTAWHGARGHIQDVLIENGMSFKSSAVYACGSDAMIHSARTSLIAAGLDGRHFYSDAFVSSD